MNSVNHLVMPAGKNICLSSSEGLKCFECFIFMLLSAFQKAVLKPYGVYQLLSNVAFLLTLTQLLHPNYKQIITLIKTGLA